MMEPNSILVLGAGELGMAVLRGLARRDHDAPLTVLLRPATIAAPDSARTRDLAELRSLGVRFLPGDLIASTPAELAELFAGFDTVIGCTGYASGRSIQLRLTQAVPDAGVRRYVPWQFGVDYDAIGRGSPQDLFDEQLDVRDLLRSQDRTEWVIISTGMFTSFLFEPSFGVVDLARRTVHALGSWETAVTVTTPEDIGVLTAAILADEPRIVNRVVFTAGDTITYGRLADIVAGLGAPVRRVLWSLPELHADLANDPGDAIKKYRAVFAQGVGVSWPMEATFNAQHGIPVMDVERYAHAHLR